MTKKDRKMLDELLQREDGLSPWEIAFLDSLDKNDEAEPLTPRQRDKLCQIWEDCYG